MSEEEIKMSFYGFPEDSQSIYIHFTEKDLLKGFREEALRYREQLSKALESIDKLKDKYKGKRIYVSRKFLKELEETLKGSDKEWVI